ncbi:MAG: YHS domain-containing protein [Candidatus Omnitrophica bacterium]|nr:YHS domain-containing protein [Candidatus Omnitrophota bacterium]
MKKLILTGLFIISSSVLFAQACRSCSSQDMKQEKECDFSKIGNYMICPVTKEKFQANEKSESSEYKGKIYIFCCPMCKGKFEKEPEKYMKGK